MSRISVFDKHVRNKVIHYNSGHKLPACYLHCMTGFDAFREHVMHFRKVG